MKEMNLRNLPDIVKAIKLEENYLRITHSDNKKKYNELTEQFKTASSALQALLDEEQGKARERIFTAYTLCEMLSEVEERVSTKKALNGTKVHYDFGQRFPKSYKYTAYSTTIEAEYRNGSWRLTKVERHFCPNHSQAGYIDFSESAKADIIGTASKM